MKLKNIKIFTFLKDVFSYFQIFFAIIFIVIGGFVVFRGQNQPEIESSTSFLNEPVKIINFELNEIPEEDKPIRIMIPKLGTDLNVSESRIIGGYWEVFEEVAGWGEGSSPPGYPGNQVIFAHAREEMFGELDSIEIDDVVYVFNDREWFSYSVTEIREVYPNNTEVIEQTEDERLTLYTCSGLKDEKRLIVTAIRSNQIKSE